MTMRKVTGLGLYMIALLALFSPARGADRLTLSSTNPTALEIDQMVAREKGFFARENIDLDVTYDTRPRDQSAACRCRGPIKIGAHFGLMRGARRRDKDHWRIDLRLSLPGHRPTPVEVARRP